MLHMRARMQCGHADVVHGEDAGTHQARGQKKAWHGKGAAADREYGTADHQHTNEKREQRRKDKIVDRKRNSGGQHADEVHCPNGNRQRESRPGKQHASSNPDGIAKLHRQGEPDVGALDCHHDGKQDEPRPVYDLHTSSFPVRDEVRQKYKLERSYFKQVLRFGLGAIVRFAL